MRDELASETYDDSFDEHILNMDLFYKKGPKAGPRGEAELLEIGSRAVRGRLDKLGEGMLKKMKDKKETKKASTGIMEEMKDDGFGQRVDELQFSDQGGDIEMEKLEDK